MNLYMDRKISPLLFVVVSPVDEHECPVGVVDFVGNGDSQVVPPDRSVRLRLCNDKKDINSQPELLGHLRNQK